MLLGHSHQQFEFTIAGDKLVNTNLEKDLGVLISGDLEWNNHINSFKCLSFSGV